MWNIVEWIFKFPLWLLEQVGTLGVKLLDWAISLISPEWSQTLDEFGTWMSFQGTIIARNAYWFLDFVIDANAFFTSLMLVVNLVAYVVAWRAVWWTYHKFWGSNA